MKKFTALCSVILIGFMLSGCASVKNPVDNNALGSAISTYGILQSAVIAYRGLPRCTTENNFSATNVCYKRSVLVKAQAYDKAANAAINNAVDFKRNNPTLDAGSYISAATLAVTSFKDFAIAAQMPGVSGVR